MTNFLLLILIGLAVFDIFDREFVQFRTWLLRKANAWSIRLHQLQLQTRKGDDAAMLERLAKVEHIRKTPWYDNVLQRRYPDMWKMIVKQDQCLHLFEEFEDSRKCKKCDLRFAR
jgi:hypothetical protein